MRDKNGRPISCGHSNCGRCAILTIGDERPDHPEFYGQTHDCCAVHSRGTK